MPNADVPTQRHEELMVVLNRLATVLEKGLALGNQSINPPKTGRHAPADSKGVAGQSKPGVLAPIKTATPAPVTPTPGTPAPSAAAAN